MLPGTVVVFVPGMLVWLSRDSSVAAQLASPGQAVFWLGLLAMAVGLSLAIWTSKLFLKVGEGTPAPWDPPTKFVVLGPYRHVRNPMISGVLFMLMGEAFLVRSVIIAGWTIIFFLANAFYLPNFEERELAGRFGEPYKEYKKHVRRWVPRLSPWMGP